jgi:hypothetical protein
MKAFYPGIIDGISPDIRAGMQHNQPNLITHKSIVVST